MTPLIKSILSCLVILATASDIHTKDMRKLESRKWLAAPGKTIVFGESIKPGQLPIVTYSVENGALYMSIYVPWNKQCNLHFIDLIGTSIKFKRIKQLTSDRVLVVWSVADKFTDVTTLSIIYMEDCRKTRSYDYSWALSSPAFVAVVTFINGFDLITSLNRRISFDTDGVQRSDPELFPTNSYDFSISAVSERTPTNGYFIVDYTHQVVKFTIPDERKKTDWKNSNLLYFATARILTNNEQSLYSVCAFIPRLTNVVTCYQYDKFGTKKWVHLAEFEFDTLLDMKNLAGGGLVLVTFKSGGNKLSFAKIGSKPGDVTVWSYSGKETFGGAKLIDFSEKDHMFILAYKSQEGTGQKSAVSQKFSLQN